MGPNYNSVNCPYGKGIIYESSYGPTHSLEAARLMLYPKNLLTEESISNDCTVSTTTPATTPTTGKVMPKSYHCANSVWRGMWDYKIISRVQCPVSHK